MTGKTVLVTGASGAIGAAIATAFAGQGARVVLGAHQNLQAANALCARLSSAGHSALACAADVGDATQVDRMFAQAEAAFGSVEVLVNNAGIAQQKMFCDITEEDWDKMMAVHVTGTYHCCQRALPAMVRQKQGAIINLSSIWGQVGASCEVHYSAAKAAVIGLTKALAKELAPSGVRVNCVAPGAVATGMLNHLTGTEKQDLCAEIPMGRLGTPQEVAAAVTFLASRQASYITGQVIGPNGGMVV